MMNFENKRFNSPARCGIILAAGEGTRLRSYIHRLRGTALPKQYVNFIGTRSMLEHTVHRAEKLIPTDRILTVVSGDHLSHPEVCRQLAGRSRETVVLQPENKETGPGLLLPLVHLQKRYPEAVVAVFPSDHFILEEELFMGCVDLACRAVEQDPSRLVLLGMKPHEPEPEYGYILPGRRAGNGAGSRVRRVARFIEKPDRAAAQELMQRGALWNSFVMVFRAANLLELVRRVVPALYRAFLRIQEAIGTVREREVVDEVYRTLAPLNFSKGVLESVQAHHALRLSVLPVGGVFWSDWGSEQRIVSVLQRVNRVKTTPGAGVQNPALGEQQMGNEG